MCFDEVVTESAREFKILWGVHKAWRFMEAM
jgi:hypothetical protein